MREGKRFWNVESWKVGKRKHERPAGYVDQHGGAENLPSFGLAFPEFVSSRLVLNFPL